MVEDEAVHHFDRRRLVPEHQRCRCQRIEQLVELDRQHRLRCGQHHEIDLGGNHQAQRPFRPDDQLRQVEGRRRIRELVEVVAADPSQHFWKAAIDLVPAAGCDAANGAVTARLEGVTGRSGRQLRRIERPKVDRGTVREHDSQLEDVIDGLAVKHRPRAARVVGNHAAERGAAGGGNVRGKAQAVGPKTRVQLVEHDARLDPCPALVPVDLEDAVQIFRGIEDETGTDGLPGLRRAATSRGNGHTVPRGNLHRPHHIVWCPGNDEPERFDLIDAGVGGVERARDPIETDLAAYPCLEVETQHASIGILPHHEGTKITEITKLFLYKRATS